MAMANATVICSVCGKEYGVSKKCYNRTEANNFEEWISSQKGTCPECYRKQMEAKRKEEQEAAIKQHEIDNAASAEKAIERGLPELEGTKKQVAWANTIRESFCENICVSKDASPENAEKMQKVLDYAKYEFTKASYWIEHRANKRQIIEDAKSAVEANGYTPVPEETKKDAEAEATVAPENLIPDSTIVKIDINENIIKIYSTKDETLRTILKENSYSWANGSWNREITKFNGPMIDRVAEIGNKVLNSGYAVRIWDEDTRRKAIKADYQPEQTRWITLFTSGDYQGRLCITWKGRDEKLYDAARTIKGSKYSGGAVIVRVEYADQIEDFAALNEFNFSDAAKEAIAVHRAMLLNKVRVSKKENTKPLSADEKLKEVLDSSREVLDDLKDED